jgi:hypothetical protein
MPYNEREFDTMDADGPGNRWEEFPLPVPEGEAYDPYLDFVVIASDRGDYASALQDAERIRERNLAAGYRAYEIIKRAALISYDYPSASTAADAAAAVLAQLGWVA